MDKSYHPKTTAAKDTDCPEPTNSKRDISAYEDRELRKHCIHLACERFGCGDSQSSIHMAEYLYEWIKTGKQKI